MSTEDAEINSLSKEYYDLLESISLNVSLAKGRAAKRSKKIKLSDKGEILWDGYYLWNFIDQKWGRRKTKFRDELDRRGTDHDSARMMQPRGVGVETFRKAVCAAAVARRQNLQQLLRDYVVFCKEDEIEIKGFNGHKPLLDEILLGRVRTKETGKASEYVDPFARLIDSLNEDYFHRDAISKKIDQFLSSYTSGYISIIGDAGNGKSSILANLVRKLQNSEKHDSAWFFIQSRTGLNTLPVFLSSIYLQLSFIVPTKELDHQFRLNEQSAQLGGLSLNNLLNFISEKVKSGGMKPLVLIIDALDEISPKDQSRASPLSNYFYLPELLPDGIIVVCSSRDNSKQTYSSKRLIINLEKSDDDHRIDIENYIKLKLKEARIRKWMTKFNRNESAVIEKLCNKSEMRFIYIAYLMRNIESYNYWSLPQGLNEFFKVEFSRFFASENPPAFLSKKIVSAISYFEHEISIQRLALFISQPPETVSDVLDLWKDRRLIDVNFKEGRGYVKFNHLSFYDFLHDISLEYSEYSKQNLPAVIGSIKDVLNGLIAKSRANANEQIRYNYWEAETLRIAFPVFMDAGDFHAIEEYCSQVRFHYILPKDKQMKLNILKSVFLACQEFIETGENVRVIKFLVEFFNSALHKSKWLDADNAFRLIAYVSNLSGDVCLSFHQMYYKEHYKKFIESAIFRLYMEGIPINPCFAQKPFDLDPFNYDMSLKSMEDKDIEKENKKYKRGDVYFSGLPFL